MHIEEDIMVLRTAWFRSVGGNGACCVMAEEGGRLLSSVVDN